LVTELLHSSRLLIHYIPHPRNRSCLGRHGREQGRSECGNCQRSEPQRYCHKHFPCDEHPHRNGFRRAPLLERRAALRKLIEPDPRSPIQFSDHIDCDGAKFFEAAAELGLEGIVSKRVASRYRSGPSRSWLKSKNMVEGEFILLGTERDSEGVPWALLATDREGRLVFAGPAIMNPPRALRAAWQERMTALAIAKPPLRGLRQDSAQWLRPELRVRVKHLKAKGVLRHATVRQFIKD
jgi:bifunctional non-homologous end joining protein LigD